MENENNIVNFEMMFLNLENLFQKKTFVGYEYYLVEKKYVRDAKKAFLDTLINHLLFITLENFIILNLNSARFIPIILEILQDDGKEKLLGLFKEKHYGNIVENDNLAKILTNVLYWITYLENAVGRKKKMRKNVPVDSLVFLFSSIRQKMKERGI